MEDRQSTTPVATKSVSTQPAKCPIDQIRVGMRVLAHNPEVSIEERSGFVQPSSEIWRFLKLEMTKPDGGILKIEMIRPSEWLEASGAKVGSEIQLDLKELGADGAALVQEILPCPEIQSGEGQVVTATFQHPPSHQVLDVIFQGNEQPMGVTSNHLFWSADKKKFVPIGEMEIGERVQTWQGETKRIVSKSTLSVVRNSSHTTSVFPEALSVKPLLRLWRRSPTMQEPMDGLLRVRSNITPFFARF